MLSTAETALSGSLSHLDLPGRDADARPGAAKPARCTSTPDDTDGIIFFEGGEIVHAECDSLFGDEAVTEIVKTCHSATAGVYKFIYGATASQRTVLRSATDLLLDAMREFDEDKLNADESQSDTGSKTDVDHAEKESS